MKFNSSVKRILKLVSIGRGVSRKTLAEETGMSQANLTIITKALIEQGYLIEGEKIGQGLGRKEILLYTNPDKFRYLGIDIGGYTVRAAVSDNNLHVVGRTEWSMAEWEDADNKAEALAEKITSFLREAGMDRTSIDACGIGVTGIVDADLRTIANIPNAGGWDGTPIADVLEEALGCPVFLDEGGRTMALAEKYAGAAGSIDHFIVVQIGFGLVSGVMLGGQLLRGADNVGGLLGHVTADDKGIRCRCGNYGCLENIVTYSMIEQAFEQRGGKPGTLPAAFRRNDKEVLAVCIEAGQALGIALSNVINLFNPRAIFVGGPVIDLLPVVFDEMRRTILLRANRFSTVNLRMEKNTFGSDEGLFGALTLAKSKFID